MLFFIDSADTAEISELKTWGVVDGVPTNPSLIAKSGRNRDEVIKEIAEIIDGPISAEVIGTDFESMIKEGRELAAIHENVVVKVPMTMDGLKATHYFSQNNIKTNVTLIFSANQALLAAKNGATYVSPFIGRLDDIGQTGMELLREIRQIFDNYTLHTDILAASIRHSEHLKEAALIGADVATIPGSIIKKLISHPLTTIGLENFLKDHANSLK